MAYAWLKAGKTIKGEMREKLMEVLVEEGYNIRGLENPLPRLSKLMYVCTKVGATDFVKDESIYLIYEHYEDIDCQDITFELLYSIFKLLPPADWKDREVEGLLEHLMRNKWDINRVDPNLVLPFYTEIYKNH